MSATNFCYQNRCIVVSDDDYEDGNYPELGEWIGNNRSYPSRKVEGEDFTFWNVIITSGYYSGSCIDYIESEKDVEYYLGAIYYYNSQKAFFAECMKEIGISEYMLRKVCGKVGDKDIEVYLEEAYENLTDYLRKIEEEEVNAYLNRIKENYGYSELRLQGVFSNGEGVYTEI